MKDVVRTMGRPANRSFRAWTASCLLLMVLTLIACGDGDTDQTRAKLLLVLEMVPNEADLPKGLTRPYTVVGTNAVEHLADVSAIVRWQSSATEVASVDANGLVRARSEGSAVISASYEEVGLFIQTHATVRVTPAAVQSMTITPNPAMSGVGLQLALKATSAYSDGTTADVTTLGAWVCGSPAVVAVQPTTGVSTGLSLGIGTVRLAIKSVAATASVAMVRNNWTPGGEASRVTDIATVLADDRVLTVGNWEYQSTLIYDPLSRTISPVADYVDGIVRPISMTQKPAPGRRRTALASAAARSPNFETARC